MMTREYKDSGIEWIGRIPKEWKISAIKHLMTLYAGATPKSDKDELWDGSIPWVTPADYKTEDVYVSLGRRNISVAGLSSCATTLLPIDSIIFSKRAPIGLVVLNNVPLCTNQGCIGCVPYKNKANSKYYYYVLSVFTEQFELYGSGTTFKEISANNFANFIVSVPPLPEQQRIADYLDKKCGEIDELIALQEQMIAQLTDYKQSVITEAVTKGLNPDAELVPSGIDWIGDVPKHWDIIKIGFIFDNLDYLREPISAELRERNNPQYDYYGASGVIDKIDHYNVDDKVLLIGEDGANLIMRNLPLVYKAEGKFWVNNHAHILKPKKDDYDYMAHALEAANYHNYITGSAQPKLSQENLQAVKIPVPPLSEQQSIASYLDTKCSEIDSLIAIKQQKIETLKDYKKSVIYEAVTGKMTLLFNELTKN